MFAELKRTPKLGAMPFTKELRERTKLTALNTWIHNQLKNRKERLLPFAHWSKERLEGYEKGLIDMALDVKNEIKKLNNNEL
jgi:hypothetical protein